MPPAAASLLVLAALVMGCGGGDGPGDPGIVVEAPGVTTEGERLPREEWREQVQAVCRSSGRAITRRSAGLARELRREAATLSEPEISRRAYEATRPLVEDQLAALAALRPPVAIEERYQAFIDALAADLEATGRLALVFAADDPEAERELGAELAESGRIASEFIAGQGLEACLLGGPVPAS